MTPSTKSSNKPKPNEPIEGWQFEAIGTKWWIGFYDQSVDVQAIKAAIEQRIQTYDRTYSRFRDDSLIADISRKAGTYTLPADSTTLLDFYDTLYRLTDGAVTPLIGQVLSDAGYDATYSFTAHELHSPPAWNKAVQHRGTTITTTKPLLLDVGAAGKGHLVDIIAGILRKHNVAAFVIDAGGDILQSHPSEPLVIGLEHPDDAALVIGTYKLLNQALCGSAGNRRAWGNFHHIMDPRTLRPVRDIKAVWVAASSAMIADGLTTALFFVPLQTLQPHFDFTYCIVGADNSLRYSPNFTGQLFG